MYCMSFMWLMLFSCFAREIKDKNIGSCILVFLHVFVTVIWFGGERADGRDGQGPSGALQRTRLRPEYRTNAVLLLLSVATLLLL